MSLFYDETVKMQESLLETGNFSLSWVPCLK